MLCACMPSQHGALGTQESAARTEVVCCEEDAVLELESEDRGAGHDGLPVRACTELLSAHQAL